jgi:hypothetical protein
MEAVRVLRGPDRRRAQRIFVVHERRRGFDRRRLHRSFAGAQLDSALVYLRANPWSLVMLLLLGNLLSLTDLVLTSVLLNLGAAEANPLMHYLIAVDPLVAAITKIGVVAVLCLVIWAFRDRRRILACGVCLPVFFSVLVIYEAAIVASLL